MTPQEQIFQNAIDDIYDLLDLIYEEQNPKMILVWNYHLFLDHQILVSILNRDIDQACRLVNILKRSIEATIHYQSGAGVAPD
jgi:hypothetical protein